MLDDRWEWVEMTRLCDPEPRYVRGRCRHLDVVPVESVVTGELVAHLCLTCDAQLPAEWHPERLPPALPLLPDPTIVQRI